MAKIKPDYDKEAMFRKIMPSSTGRQPEPKAPSSDSPEDTLLQRPEGGVDVRRNKKDEQILINIVEYLVIEKLDQAFSRFNCCKCDRCRKDVAAIALNNLKPKYVVAEKSRLGAYTALISSTEVTNAVIKAILLVREKPRH